MIRILLATLLSAIALVQISAQKNSGNTPNLLQNGNFSKGTESWEVFLTDPKAPIKAHIIERGDSYEKYGLADNYVGTNFVELDSKSAISQKTATKAGEPHVLVFAYAHRPEAGDKQLIVEINGKAIWTKTVKNTSEAGTFTYKIIKFVPDSNNTSVALYAVSLGGDGEKGVLVTDVLINEEPTVDLKLFYEY